MTIEDYRRIKKYFPDSICTVIINNQYVPIAQDKSLFFSITGVMSFSVDETEGKYYLDKIFNSGHTLFSHNTAN